MGKLNEVLEQLKTQHFYYGNYLNAKYRDSCPCRISRYTNDIVSHYETVYGVVCPIGKYEKEVTKTRYDRLLLCEDILRTVKKY